MVAIKPDAPLAVVPDLFGKSLAEAQKLLIQAHLVTGVIGDDPDARAAEGTVARQAPAAGTQVGMESAVSLVIKTKATPVGPGPISWQGSFKVRQTFHMDVDAASEVTNRTVSVLWFHAETATARFLEPHNGAQIAFTKEATLSDCQKAIASAPLKRISLADLEPGTLIAVRTNLGRYAVLTLASRVGPSPATLELKYIRFLVRITLPFKTLEMKPAVELKAVPIQPKTLSIPPNKVSEPVKTPTRVPTPSKTIERNDLRQQIR
jgi:hypothetical protein